MRVSDAGPGIADGLGDRIFERGDSQAGAPASACTSPARSLSRQGSLRVLDGEPTRFELRLPRLAS